METENMELAREILPRIVKSVQAGAVELTRPRDDSYILRLGAVQDFNRSDYSSAKEVVELLEEHVDYWRNMAESLAGQMKTYGLIIDGDGSIVNNPFVMVDGGAGVGVGVGVGGIGPVEVLDVREHDRSALWRDYVRPYLECDLTGSELEWITENFSEQIIEEFVSGKIN